MNHVKLSLISRPSLIVCYSWQKPVISSRNDPVAGVEGDRPDFSVWILTSLGARSCDLECVLDDANSWHDILVCGVNVFGTRGAVILDSSVALSPTIFCAIFHLMNFSAGHGM